MDVKSIYIVNWLCYLTLLKYLKNFIIIKGDCYHVMDRRKYINIPACFSAVCHVICVDLIDLLASHHKWREDFLGTVSVPRILYVHAAHR